jgi:uncharacterized protein with ATP-grasp and redox domains
MRAALELVRDDPGRHGRLDILVLDELRTAALRAGGIVDEFRLIKQRENEAALNTLAGRLEALDRLAGEALIEELMRGLLAGNLFDMGVPESAERFGGASIPFAQVLADVPTRPWRYDDLDAFVRWMEHSPLAKVLIFADNAGADIVLGVLPVARFFVQRDTAVVIAANAAPSLNDVTHEELGRLRSRAVACDVVFASPRLTIVDSGCTAPLIDFAAVSEELVAESRDADLIVLDGMGRAIESNWTTRFTRPCLRVAMLKDPQVARSVEGQPFDAVCRFDVGG